MIRVITVTESSAGEVLGRLMGRTAATETFDERVKPILDAIRIEKDQALLRYARELDGLGDSSARVSPEEIRQAGTALTDEFRAAVHTAIENIRQYALAQMPRQFFEEFSPGRRLGWIVRPLRSVGCYVPSGKYPLPSSLLMTAVLAQAAGVERICVTSPHPSIEILGCAHILGIDEVYRVGGAQAIAALAFGTNTIQKVDRIVGPGNAYVAAAKKLLAGEVGIDFVAGPTEILVLAAEGDPKLIAADMLAQAEHDTTATAALFTTSEALARQVAAEIELQLAGLCTSAVAREAIDQNGCIAIFPDMQQAVALANSFAPEHLSLHDESLLPEIRNAGTVFIGPHTPESAGDYANGPSHVLPTNGLCRLRGGLSVTDFLKIISVQQLSPSALAELAPVITTLARAEGLEAHARAVEVRSVQ